MNSAEAPQEDLMVPFGFDQTNGKADGLLGDDQGSISPKSEPAFSSLIAQLGGSHPDRASQTAADRDNAVTGYSEEGAL